MDKQQKKMNQNPNQEVEYISAFLDEDEEVNESDFDESIEESEKTNNLEENQQNKPEEEEQSKKPKRPRKTIEQEIAELDEKRQKLMEKKRRQEAHEKIVFGGACINIFKIFYQNKEDQNKWEILKKQLYEVVASKDVKVLEKIIRDIE